MGRLRSERRLDTHRSQDHPAGTSNEPPQQTHCTQRGNDMKFTSEWTKGAVFWRTFARGDSVYIIGLREGKVSTGGSVVYNNHEGFFQMELKRGDLFGSTIMAAGQVFANTDEYVLLDSGDFTSVYDATAVSVDPVFKFQPCGGQTQFFTAGSADTTVKITSTVAQTTTQSGQSQTTFTTDATDETGVQVGAQESASTGTDFKVGVNLNEAFSSKVTDKISQVVSTVLNVSVSTQTTYSEDQTVVCKANKLTACQVSWQRRYVTGTADLGTRHMTFDATIGYLTSRNITEYDSPDQLPPDLMAAYVAAFPGYHPPVNLADGSVLREKDNAPVYVIFGGAKFWIPDAGALSRLYGGWGAVQIVPDGALANVPTTPRDQTLLREEDHPEVWLMQDGAKRHVVSPDVLNKHGGWGQVHVVPDNSTATFPTGDPVTS
ncbi:MAG: hypothetical protein QM695_14010 [Micropruina sp.]